MDKEFERRMMLAANPRARKRRGKQPEKFVQPKTHIGALLRDLMTDAPDMPRSGGLWDPNPVVMEERVIAGLAAPVLAIQRKRKLPQSRPTSP